MRKRFQSLAVTWLVAVALLAARPTEGHAQPGIPQAVVAAAPWVRRAAETVAKFLAGWNLGNMLNELTGEGLGFRDSLATLRADLENQAQLNATNRRVLVRYAAMIDTLSRDIGMLKARRPSATEATTIGARTLRFLDEAEELHARIVGLESKVSALEGRVTRLELDSLRQVLLSPASVKVLGVDTPASPLMPPTEPGSEARDNEPTGTLPPEFQFQLQTARSIFDTDQRDAEYARLVSIAVAGGALDRAFEVASNIFRTNSRDVIYRTITRAHLNRGELEEGRRVAGRIFDTPMRDAVYKEIIAAAAKRP